MKGLRTNLRVPLFTGQGTDPVLNLWWIFKMRVRVLGGGIDSRAAPFHQHRCRNVRSVHPLEHSNGDMIAADLIQHDHLKWRRRCALLVEAAHVEAICARTAVHDGVPRALVTVEGKAHRLLDG